MLIKCPECGNQISDKSEVCIHCGAPIAKILENQKECFYDLKISNLIVINESTSLYSNKETVIEARKCLQKEKELLQEILGYTKNEATQIINSKFICIAKNLPSNLACEILGIFYANNINIMPYLHDNQSFVFINKVKGWNDNYKIIKDHYYDEPIVSRDYLCDVFTPEKIEPIQLTPTPQPTNIPKCPTCGSTNIKKISNLNRAASVSAFGLFSKKINKSFKCSSCGYTW